MNVLTLETTCDETAAAIVTDQFRVLSSVVASQDALHQRFHGVVPEIAARAHVERILPVIDEALRLAELQLDDIGAVGVANTPGLAGSLMVGLVTAKALCLALDKPLIAINHLHAHIYACRFSSKTDVFPCIGLIASGGHSNIYLCDSPCDFQYLGGTIDDAAGESFDKVASMLGLPYPGGPAIGQVAESGDPQAFHFPRPFLSDTTRLDFSFSGLKTAVRYTIAGYGKSEFVRPAMSAQRVADLAASFQEAVVDCLVGKAILAVRQVSLRRPGLRKLCVGGGVAANTRLRQRLGSAAAEADIDLTIAPPALCTDNAVMGAIAIERLKAGLVEDLDLDVLPGLVRG